MDPFLYETRRQPLLVLRRLPPNLHDPKRNESPHVQYLSDNPLEEAQHIMNNPEWTVRELYCIRSSSQATAPISLLGQGCLSDWTLWKFYVSSLHYESNGKDLEECIEKHEDFSFSLLNITTCTCRTLPNNVHWRSIYSRIDEKWWPQINVLGNMENLTRVAKTQKTF